MARPEPCAGFRRPFPGAGTSCGGSYPGYGYECNQGFDQPAITGAGACPTCRTDHAHTRCPGVQYFLQSVDASSRALAEMRLQADHPM